MTKQSMQSTAPAWESQQVLVMTPTGFDISCHDRTQDWLHSPLLLRIFFAEFVFVQLIFFLARVAAPWLLNLKTQTHGKPTVACMPWMMNSCLSSSILKKGHKIPKANTV
jgi:hypothetical protein